jgi:hypothetical protein
MTLNLTRPWDRGRVAWSGREWTEMKRKLNIVVICACAIGALSGLSAPNASAAGERFRCDGPCIFTGTTEEGVTEEFKASGVTIKCHGEYEATQAGTEATTMTVSAQYTKCNNSTTISTNHCAWIFAAETNGAGDATWKSECVGGSKVEIAIPGVCTLTIGEQTAGGGLHYTNVGTSSITMEETIGEVVFSKAGGALCGLISGKMSIAGRGIFHCYRDEGSELTGTTRTTPRNLTTEGPNTACEWR